MNILVTGANGFIGKNLISVLKTYKDYNIFQYDVDSELETFEIYTKECDFVFHLAGVNRPESESEFMQGNVDFTAKLLDNFTKNNSKAPVLMTSSIQAELDNPYGRSKKAAEDLLKQYTGVYYIYRLPNVFGKWCRPNYNSVVATFCHNIAHGIDITVNNADAAVTLVYIDDVIECFIKLLAGKRCEIEPVYKVTVGKTAELIYSFKESRNTKQIADMSDGFTKKLYSTYLSYLPEDKFGYPLKMNIDERGSFTEFIKIPDGGQVSVNISKPGITKGNHWHQTKTEKFLVVQGCGVIKFRQIGGDKIIEYEVNGEKLEAVDIPPGYTHNILNTGVEDMITIMWANEQFDPDKPDTIFEEV